MAYVLPTLEEMHSFLIALMRVLLPGRDVSRWSFNWKWLRVLSGAVTDNHAHISATIRDLMPDTAEGDGLERWGDLLGVARKSATPARKQNALRVVGTVGATVPLDAELTHDSGLRFKINEATVIPAAGRVDVDLVAIDVGAATRLSSGEVLTFVAAPAGLEETAELVADLDEDGTDLESDGAYRLRVLSRLNSPPLGGAQEDFRQWSLELEGIADAFVYPNRQGLGSVDVAALHEGSGTARVLTSGELAELQAHLDDRRPVGVRALRALSVVTEPVDVEAVVRPTGEQEYAFDWNDSTPPVVSAFNPATRVLSLTLPRPATIKAGDRISIKSVSGVGGYGTGQQYVIESLPVTTTDLVLEEAPTVSPVVNDLVYSGGPLVDTVRAALLAHLDTLGTANPDSVRYGAWEGNVRPAAIIRIASAVPGVLDVPATVPVATIEADDPPWPDDDEIGLLVPRQVIVREAH